MTSQEMIDKIYEVIADKSETEGCICEFQLPIELSTNGIKHDGTINSFVNSFFHEGTHIFYIKRIKLNGWVNVVDFDISELPAVFDKYKKYILRSKDKFFIKKISKQVSGSRGHISLEGAYDEKGDWSHWKDYFSKYNHNSKERYSVTYMNNIVDGRGYIHYESDCNSNIVKIIGHPVMIGDIINRMQNNISLFYGNTIWHVLSKIYTLPRGDFRKPIENQSEECIEYIYNLITKHVPEKENNN